MSKSSKMPYSMMFIPVEEDLKSLENEMCSSLSLAILKMSKACLTALIDSRSLSKEQLTERIEEMYNMTQLSFAQAQKQTETVH